MKNKPLISALLFACIYLTACSYNGTVRSDFHQTRQNLEVSNKIPASIAIVQTAEFKNRVINESEGGYTITITTHPAFINAIANEMSTVFTSVSLIDGVAPKNGEAILAFPKFSYKQIESNRFRGTFQYETILEMTYKYAKTNEHIAVHQAKDVISFGPPSSVHVLGVFTGLSLFALSPITMPASAQIIGDHATTLFEQSMGNLLAQISDQAIIQRQVFNRPQQ